MHALQFWHSLVVLGHILQLSDLVLLQGTAPLCFLLALCLYTVRLCPPVASGVVHPTGYLLPFLQPSGQFCRVAPTTLRHTIHDRLAIFTTILGLDNHEHLQRHPDIVSGTCDLVPITGRYSRVAPTYSLEFSFSAAPSTILDSYWTLDFFVASPLFPCILLATTDLCGAFLITFSGRFCRVAPIYS